MENSVHVVYPESGDKQKTRTLHCNLLLLVNDLPVEVPPHSVTSISEKEHRKAKAGTKLLKQKNLQLYRKDKRLTLQMIQTVNSIG